MPDLAPYKLSLVLAGAGSAPFSVAFAPFYKGDPGPPGEGGMPADFRENMSKLEGKHNLRDLYAALADYHPSPTPTGDAQTLIGIGCWGDSVSPHVWSQLLLLLFQSHKQGAFVQPTTMGVEGTDTLTATGTVFRSDLADVDQTVMDGTGGKADFTYLPGGDHIRLSNGATLTITAGQNRDWSTARAYFATGPGMGTVKVDLLDVDNGDALLNTATINLTGASLGGAKAQFSAATDPDINLRTHALKLRITATGTVVFLRGGFFSAFGLVPVTFGRGGSTLTQQNYASTAVTAYLMAELNVKLMVVQAKEENPAVAIPAMHAKFATLPASSVLVVGSLPDSGDAATLIAANAVFRSNALANRAVYFDGYSAIGDYAELNRLGWAGDGTHPADAANRFVAGMIMGELNLMHVFGTVERRDIDSRRIVGDLYIRFPGGVTEVITSYGGSEADKAKIANIAELHFGPEGSAPRLRQRSPNSIQILDSSGNTLGSFFVGNIEQAADNQQNYWGVPVYRVNSVWYSFATDQPVQD